MLMRPDPAMDFSHLNKKLLKIRFLHFGMATDLIKIAPRLSPQRVAAARSGRNT
jgi:hypothetical protein